MWTELGGAPNGMRDPRFAVEDDDEDGVSARQRREESLEQGEYDTIQERDDA